MDWMKIGAALLLVMMIVMLFPRAKQMLTDSPKAEKGDWSRVMLPIIAVIGFVVLLMAIV